MLGLAGFLAARGTRTVTVTVVAPQTSKQQGAPVVVTINPAQEDGLTPIQKFSLSHGVAGCGTERAAVKHLTDGFVLPANANVMTPEQLVSLAAPPVTQTSPRFPVEQQLVVLENVHVIAAKREADSDLHVLLISPTGAELNVEAPQAQCDSASPYADPARAGASGDGRRAAEHLRFPLHAARPHGDDRGCPVLRRAARPARRAERRRAPSGHLFLDRRRPAAADHDLLAITTSGNDDEPVAFPLLGAAF